MNWFKRLWNRLVRIFKKFIDIAIPIITQMLIAEFKDFAINAVDKIQSTDLSNSEKREEVFKEIKTEALSRGKTLSDSVINLLIELALQYIKNKL